MYMICSNFPVVLCYEKNVYIINYNIIIVCVVFPKHRKINNKNKCKEKNHHDIT